MADPTVKGPEGDGGIDGVMDTLGETLGGLIRGAGDYLHERFFGTGQRPASDAPYHRDGSDNRSPNDRVKGKGPEGKYRGFEFWPITGIWAVGAAAAVVGLVILLRKR